VDLEKVFYTIAAVSRRLLSCRYGYVWRLEGDANVAVYTTGEPEAIDALSDAWRRLAPTRAAMYAADLSPTDPLLSRAGLRAWRTTVGAAMRNGRSVQAWGDAEALLAAYPDLGFEDGYRGPQSRLTVPLLRNGEPIGVLSVLRRAGQAFDERQVDVLETFADQAVIAIENARLFEELQESNSSLR
jgi:GAF domain-containing protein